MRTIERPHGPTLYHIRCKNGECGALIECKLYELKVTQDRNETVYMMKCPHCRTETFLSSVALEQAIAPIRNWAE